LLRNSDAEAETNEFEDEKELLKTPPREDGEAPAAPPADGKVTSDQIDKLSSELGEKWKDLAEELRHITSKDIKTFEEDAEDDALRARIALVRTHQSNLLFNKILVRMARQKRSRSNFSCSVGDTQSNWSGRNCKQRFWRKNGAIVLNFRRVHCPTSQSISKIMSKIKNKN
jgi:hypothetical protein